MQSKKLGEKLRELRKEKGYSLQNLADLLGLSPQAISQYELNKRDIPTLTLCAIFNVLGVKENILTDLLVSLDDIEQAEKLAFLSYVINSTGGIGFSFVSIQVSQDKVLNGMYQKLLDFGYLVEAKDKAFRITNRTSGNIYFLSTQEVKDLYEDAESYLKSRLEALEQKLKDQGTRGLW